VSDETRNAIATLWDALSPSSRIVYQTPDDLLAALTIRRIPLGEAQLVWLNQSGPDNAEACVFIKDPVNPLAYGSSPTQVEGGVPPPQLSEDKSSISAYLALRREGNSWRLVVPPTAIKTLAKQMNLPSPPGR